MRRCMLVVLLGSSFLGAFPRPRLALFYQQRKEKENVNFFYDGPKYKILQMDTMMVAIARFGRDYQTNGPTPIRLWSSSAWSGIYTGMFSGIGYVWNFYDSCQETWSASDTGFFSAGNALFVNYYPNCYQYYPFWAQSNLISWPESLSFCPFWWNGNTSQVSYQVYEPRVSTTVSGHLHLFGFDLINQYLIYDRMIEICNAPVWEGGIFFPIPGFSYFYASYTEPSGKTLVLTYWNVDDSHIKMLVDTLEGNMFLGGTYIQKDLGTELSGYTANYFGFVGDGHPFIDRDGNIHHIYFGSNGTQRVPVEVWHFFWDLFADTTHWTKIDEYTGPIYYSVDINTLNAGRAQMGQNPDNGNLYAIWEEFIQEPGRFVVNSTNDTFAPVRIKLAQSYDNGRTWTIDTLIESDVSFGNHWIRFPVLSPTILSSAPNLDQAIWGFYEDYDPGFFWQGHGVDSTVVMWVGIKDYPVLSVTEKPIIARLHRESILFNVSNPVENSVNIKYEIPVRSSVSLRVFDISGRVIKTLVNGVQEPGIYEVVWNLKNSENINVPSGTYFYILKTNEQIRSRKVTQIFR